VIVVLEVLLEGLEGLEVVLGVLEVVVEEVLEEEVVVWSLTLRQRPLFSWWWLFYSLGG